MDAALTDAVVMDDAPDPAALVEEPLATTGEPDFRMIELLFFAYREFTTDADFILEEYGFGRAHHRVLHFVNRSPGLGITELLDLLRITKQSLSRVLRQLIDEGFVAQTPGREDRRQRCLYPTRKGRELTLSLSRAQANRIDAALAALGPGQDRAALERFLAAMAGEREATREWFRRKGILESMTP